MNIKITSDSTCDLSAAQLAEHNITLARLTVVKGSRARVILCSASWVADRSQVLSEVILIFIACTP